MPKPDVSAERKAQILAAASNIFLKKGFDAARMEEIAAGAGLSIGGVYWYYKSKEEVILDLMDSITNTDLDDLHVLLDAPGTVVERLEGLHPRQCPAGGEALAALLRFLRPGRTRPPCPQPPASVLSRLPPGHRGLAGPGRGAWRVSSARRRAARDPVCRALRRDARDGDARPRKRTGRVRAGQRAGCAVSRLAAVNHSFHQKGGVSYERSIKLHPPWPCARCSRANASTFWISCAALRSSASWPSTWPASPAAAFLPGYVPPDSACPGTTRWPRTWCCSLPKASSTPSLPSFLVSASQCNWRGLRPRARTSARSTCGACWCLFGFGVLHLILFWTGDILRLYAVLGFALLAFRKRSNRTLLIWAGALFALSFVILGFLGAPGGKETAIPGFDIVGMARAAYTSSSYLAVLGFQTLASPLSFLILWLSRGRA